MDEPMADGLNKERKEPRIWRVKDFSGQLLGKPFPDLTSDAPFLEVLNLRNCELSEFPEELPYFPRLKTLDLRGNQLSSIPEEFFFGMESLEHLDLAKNQLTELPDTIACLSRLRHLDLRGNKLHSLPLALGRLSSLRLLDLTGQANKDGGEKNEIFALRVPAVAVYGQGQSTLARGLTHLYTRGTTVPTEGTIAERLLKGCAENGVESDLYHEWTGTFPEREDQSLVHRAIFMVADDPLSRVMVLSIRRGRRGFDIRLAARRADENPVFGSDVTVIERRVQRHLDLAARAVDKAMRAPNPASELGLEYGRLKQMVAITGAGEKLVEYPALIIMTDLKGSTGYPQSTQRRYMEKFWDVIRQALKELGATPTYIRPTGDGVCMAYPSLYGGLLMALGIAAKATGDEGMALFRIGINWGNVLPFKEFSSNEDEFGIQGTAIAIAARLEQSGTPGRVLAYHTLKDEFDKMPEECRDCFNLAPANPPDEIEREKLFKGGRWKKLRPSSSGPGWAKPWTEEGVEKPHEEGQLIDGYWISLKPKGQAIIDSKICLPRSKP